MTTKAPAFQKAKKKRNTILSAALIFLLALGLTACSTNKETGKENGEQKAEAGENLVIPISEVSKTPTFYPVTVDGTRMEVFAVKASDGTIRTAFNTCQVCNGSPKAYFEQSGDAVQCQNCGNIFPMSRVGIESGGCNPVPIIGDKNTVTDESITVPYETLQANAYRFPENWKE